MAELTVQQVSKSGVADVETALAAADATGDSVRQAEGLLLVVNNGDASSHTITVSAPKSTQNCGNLGALPVSDISFVVAAGDIGFLTIPAGYGNGDFFQWSYDAVTSVSVGVFSLSP